MGGDTPAAVQLVIFGGRGELARHKLIPARARLAADPEVPRRELMIIAIAGTDECDGSFRNARDGFGWLAPRSFYRRGDVRELESLARGLDELAQGRSSGRLFYLALARDLFVPTVANLSAARLLDMRERARVTSPAGPSTLVVLSQAIAAYGSRSPALKTRCRCPLTTAWPEVRVTFSPSRRKNEWDALIPGVA